MPAYIFESIKNKGAKLNITPSLQAKSINWFRTTARNSRVNPRVMLKQYRERMVKIPKLGNMYFFAYDPKTKAKLPYYDLFPLVLPFDAVRLTGRAGTSEGFMGLNLHYLPPQLRGRLMNNLYSYLNNENLSEDTKFKISYRLLKRVSQLRFFRPCVKRYLFSHMRTQFLLIDPSEWDMALMLPLSKFVGASEKKVYKHSREQVQ